MYASIEEAQSALGTAALDTAADLGEEAVEAAWSDLVHAIADCCPDDVAAELVRRNL